MPSREQTRITSLNLLATFLLVQPRMQLTFRMHGWLLLELVSAGTPRTIYAKLLCSQVVPSLSCCMDLSCLRSKNLHLLVPNFQKFLPGYFSSLLRVL